MGVRAVGKNSSQLRQQRDPKFHARRPSPAFSYLRTPSACPPRCHILHSEGAPRDASLPLPYSLPQIPQEHLATLRVTCQVMSKAASTTWKFPQLLVHERDCKKTDIPGSQPAKTCPPDTGKLPFLAPGRVWASTGS